MIGGGSAGQGPIASSGATHCPVGGGGIMLERQPTLFSLAQMTSLRPIAWHRFAAAAIAAASLLPPPASPAAAQQRTIVIERFDAELEVHEDASMTVTERLRLRFNGQWNGIQRDIALQHADAEGRRARLRIEVLSATDAAGNPLRTEEERESGARRVRIWIPGAQDATRDVVLRYRVGNPLRFFEASDASGYHDELYWQVTGTRWDLPILHASAIVRLPAAAQGVQAWAYTGHEGSTAQGATVNVQGPEVRVIGQHALEPFQGLTVSVAWEPGVVRRPGPAAKAMREGLFWWPAALPLLALFWMGRTWMRIGRDPEERAIAVQYEPPDGLSPAEIGTLVDHTAEMKDITSTLVDLAVRGYVLIEERKEKRLLLFTDTEYRFHLRRPRDQWTDLRPHERRYLDGLFARARSRGPLEDAPPGVLESVEMEDLKDRFYKHLDGIRDAIYDRLVRQGYYARRPDKVRAGWSAFGVAAAVAAVAGAIWISGGGPLLAGPLPLGVGGALAGVIVLTFAQFLPARTERGARSREAALGFKEFLDRVESERYRAMITGPELFEKYLPHAVAFGVEDRWVRAFADLLTTPPEWYHGGNTSGLGGFDASGFSKSMSSLSSAASTTMSSSPSGSGGGGSVGGGSGGGGGSGF